MSFSIELPQTYTFSLCIDRGGHTIVDTTVEVPDTREGITRAKRTVQRLMNEYAPTPKAPDPAGLNPESQPPADLLPAAETAPTPPPEKKSEGARGLLRLHCPECGNTFGTFLREYQTEIECKCGHHIDLTGQLGRYHATCPYCQHESWGKTNSEEPVVEVQCKCKEMIRLQWVPEAREYQN